MKWKISTLIENNPDRQSKMTCEHGLSLLIEGCDADKKETIRLLMDTGDSGAFYDNAKEMGVSLSNLSAILLSHAHYDHAGGFLRFIREEGAPKNLYVGEGFFKKSFLVKADGRLAYIGIRFDRRMLEDLGVGIHEITQDSLELFPGLTLHRNFESFYDWEPMADIFVYQYDSPSCFGGRCMDSMLYQQDHFKEETAVTLDTDKGLIVIAGCSHPGIMNIIHTIETRTGKKICGVIGGTHLIDSDENRLKKTIEAFKDHDLSLIAVSHCTGEKNLPALEEAFGDKFIYNNTGNIIEI